MKYSKIRPNMIERRLGNGSFLLTIVGIRQNMPPDFESIILNNLMQRLDEIQHEQSKMHSDIAVLLVEQKNIKNELTEHKAQAGGNTSTIGKILTVAKQWIFPIILAIFILGRQSVEYSKPVYPPKSVISAQVDDTFVDKHNQRIDSILYNQLLKTVKP